MPSATVTAGNTATTPGTKSTGGKGTGLRPFTKGSAEHYEPVAYDVTVAMSAAGVVTMPDIEIPASGYFRALLIYVSTTAGAGTSVTLTQDAPFNAIQNPTLQEPNGSIIDQWDDGYLLHLTNKFGGFFGKVNDPRQSHNYSTTVGSSALFNFVLRVPVEVLKRDALCALPNQNMAAKYRFKYNLAQVSTVFGGTVSTPPNVRVRAVLEAWEQPLEVVDGIPQATKPILVNSTQFHTVQNFTISAAGQLQIPLTRLGNRLRMLTFKYTDASNSRSANDASWPDPFTVSFDNRPVLIIPRYLWLEWQSKYWGYIAALANTVAAAGTAVPSDSGGGRENGVWCLPFNTEFMSHVGGELGDLWWKTLTTSRVEISGNFGAAGKLAVITNDIALTGEL